MVGLSVFMISQKKILDKDGRKIDYITKHIIPIGLRSVSASEQALYYKVKNNGSPQKL